MIAFIEGRLVRKKATQAVVDTGGVGYEVNIPLTTYEALPSEGETVRLLTYLQVREDLQRLFGFYTEQERALFRLLISVNGIGPGLGLSILSGSSTQELKQAIRTENIAALSAIPGIGRKTAQRVIVELKEKISLLAAGPETSGTGMAPARGDDAIVNDALAALASLGLKPPTARAAVDRVLAAEGKKLSLQELIRKALQHI